MDITYTVNKNILTVTKDGESQDILIYTTCPFKLTEQFRILNLYLNLPVLGLFSDLTIRTIPEGSEYSTRYRSNSSDPSCQYLTFDTLSNKDEAHRLSRIVLPRNELLQLYQNDLVYKISYEIKNKSKCTSSVSFLYADFSQDSTSGVAYPLIDIYGNDIAPIQVRDCVKGYFLVNGWNYPILVKETGKVQMDMIVTALEGEEDVFPPTTELILPIVTKFGTIDIPIYLNENVNNLITRYVYDEFKGVNSIIRGHHFSNTNFPCFGSAGNIINPPPYFPDPGNNILQETVYTITSNVGIIKKIGDWRGVIYTFDSMSIMPSDGRIYFSGNNTFGSEVVNIVNPVAVYEITVTTVIGFSFFVSPNLNITASMSSGNQFLPFTICDCTTSCMSSWPSQINDMNTGYTGTRTFTFDTQLNKAFVFIMGGNNLNTDNVVSSSCSLTATITLKREGACVSP